jgi:hypothetical protein
MIFVGAGPVWFSIIVLAICLCKMSSLADETIIEDEPLDENWDWPVA